MRQGLSLTMHRFGFVWGAAMALVALNSPATSFMPSFSPQQLRSASPLLMVPVSSALDLTTQQETMSLAKRYVSLGNSVKQQLGPADFRVLEEELAEDFEFVAPIVGPLKKSALVEASKGLDFGAAMPDFDARYHDWRPDSDDPRRVWCSMRVTATQTGPLAFGGMTKLPQVPPAKVESPPEAVSFRFDEKGKLREITTGYVMDRRVGNTGGLGGVFGIFEAIGSPLPSPLTRTTGELLAPLMRLVGVAPPKPDPSLLQVPKLSALGGALPEGELLRLTQQLLDSNFRDESLLAPSFTYTGPVVGPLPKAAFVAAFSSYNPSEAFPDLDYQYRDLRACSFDTNRVWYTSSPQGTHTGRLVLPGGASHEATGRVWASPPECGSAQFDSEGKCVGLTGGYVMDRRQGNTGGLGGVFGICVALGVKPPFPVFLLRTLAQNVASLQESVFGKK